MANKHTKGISALTVVRETQIKPRQETTRHLLRRLKQNTDRAKARQDAERWELSHAADGNARWYHHFGK